MKWTSSRKYVMNRHLDSLSTCYLTITFTFSDIFHLQLVASGSSTITRSSVDSVVTVKSENLFRQLEKLDRDAKRQGADINTFKNVDAACGCGWPQHLLLTKGTADGMPFDLFVIITDGSLDGIRENKGCRDALSFCGIIDDEFPDKRPMGYPFDRLPFNDPDSNNRVNSIQRYTELIPNSMNVRISIKHDAITPPRLMKGMTIDGMKMIDEEGNAVVENKPARGGKQLAPRPGGGQSGGSRRGLPGAPPSIPTLWNGGGRYNNIPQGPHSWTGPTLNRNRNKQTRGGREYDDDDDQEEEVNSGSWEHLHDGNNEYNEDEDNY